jgi:hypothetical protein
VLAYKCRRDQIRSSPHLGYKAGAKWLDFQSDLARIPFSAASLASQEVVLGAAALVLTVGASSGALGQNCVSSGFPRMRVGFSIFRSFFTLGQWRTSRGGRSHLRARHDGQRIFDQHNRLRRFAGCPANSANGGTWIRGIGGVANAKSTTTMNGIFLRRHRRSLRYKIFRGRRLAISRPTKNTPASRWILANSALANHVPRFAPMSGRVLINWIWY